jgi:uncharacterized protein (TIGR00255 family)
MIKSMTGYGRAEDESRNGKIVVEVSATNRRYLEIFIGLPQELNHFEKDLRDLVGKFVKRGRVQIHVNFEAISGKTEFFVNVDLAESYAEALRALCKKIGLKDDISLKDILVNKEILSLQKAFTMTDELKHLIVECLTRALMEFTKMREREGTVLQLDILKRLKMIEVKVKEIESLAPLAVQRYESRLRKKMSELVSDLQGNDEKILREVAVMAERLDITEEIVRMLSHIQQFSQVVNSDDSVGRLLDFLVQEMVREVNTVASKSNDLQISKITVEIRNELDKIREQIQNIE